MTRKNSIKISYKLSDLYDLQMGKTPARDRVEYWQDGQYDWASISDLSKCDKYIDATKEKITKKAIDESGIKIIPADTVIMSFKLSIGKVAITKKPLYSNEAIMAFIDKKIVPISTQYAYFMLSARSWSQGVNQAVKGITLNKNSLSQYRVYIHDENMQEHIVTRLNKLSDIIELRKSQLEKSDLLVKAKFYEMFWASDAPIIKVGNVLKTTSGGTPPKEHSEYYTNGNIPWLTSGEVAQGFIYKVKNRITEQGLANSSAKWLPVNTVVIAMYGATAGQVGLLKIATTANQAVCGILPNNHFNPLYLYYAVLQKKDWMISQCMGGAQPNISQSIIKKMEIAQPPLNEQNIFAHFVERTEKIKSKIIQSLEKLELLKQSLLQKYFG